MTTWCRYNVPFNSYIFTFFYKQCRNYVPCLRELIQAGLFTTINFFSSRGAIPFALIEERNCKVQSTAPIIVIESLC